MADEYVWRQGSEIAVLDGNRSDVNRRTGDNRRGKGVRGVFAVHVINQRKTRERRQTKDRRKSNNFFSRESLIEKAGSLIVGIVILLLGSVSLITGITFFPVAGVLLGLAIAVAGIGFMLLPIRT